MNTNTDQICKVISLEASRSRVWRALTDAREFGTWFQAEFEGAFQTGAWTKGKITHPDCEGGAFEAFVERMDAEEVFAFRWHAYHLEPGEDRADHPTTLVEFLIEDEGSGTRLTVTESGFDALPENRREEAFIRNEGGWTEQMKNITRHVDG